MTDTPWAPAKPKKQNTGLRLNLWLIANAYALLFTALKLTGVIAWSWWAVFSPVLGVTCLMFILGVLTGIAKIAAGQESKRGRQ